VAIPKGFRECVREAKDQHVVHRPLAEEMIDAENTGFVEDGQENFVQLQGRGLIVPEGFFDDDRASPAPCDSRYFRPRFRTGPAGWPDSTRADARPSAPAQGLERRRVLVVAIHVSQHSAQLFKCRRIDPAVFFQAVLCSRAELVQIPTGLGTPTTGTFKFPRFTMACRAGKFLVGQIAGGSKKTQRVGMLITHQLSPNQPSGQIQCAFLVPPT